MGVNADNFSTYPEESAENISALGQLLDNHNKDGDAHSEQFDHLAGELAKVGKALDEKVDGVLDAKETVEKVRTDVLGVRDAVASAAADVRKSADDCKAASEEIGKAKSEIDVAKGTVQELVRVAGEKVETCEKTAERVGKMISDAEAVKGDAFAAASSAYNFAEDSKEKAEEAADSAQLAKKHADRAEDAADVAKSVHPKIINGIWWVYDADKGEMVSSGIKAEGGDGHTPVRGVDYWTSADRERMKNEVASVVAPVIIGDVWHVYDSETGSVVSTGVTAVAKDGYTPQKGIDYFDGDKGEPGADGYSPVKGVDYYTEAEKKEFVGEVLRESNMRCANALKGSVSGNFVSITDVSPIEHNVGVKVSSKNLFNPEAETQKILNQYYTGVDITDLVKSGLPLYLSMKLKDGKTCPNVSYFGVAWIVNNSVSAYWFIQSSEQKYTSLALHIPAKAERIGIVAMSQAHWDAVMDAFDIQLEIGTTATEYTPYVKAEDVRVSVFGKNLIPYPFPRFEVSGTNNELTAVDLGDGGVLLNGTVSVTTFVHLAKTDIGSRYISGAGSEFSANKYSDNIKTVHHNTNHLSYIQIAPGTTCDNVIFYPQIEVGSECTEFEKGIPYKSLTPNADGSVDGIESVSPYMNILCNDNSGAVVCDVVYNKDANKVIESLTNAIISLGGNV